MEVDIKSLDAKIGELDEEQRYTKEVISYLDNHPEHFERLFNKFPIVFSGTKIVDINYFVILSTSIEIDLTDTLSKIIPEKLKDRIKKCHELLKAQETLTEELVSYKKQSMGQTAEEYLKQIDPITLAMK